MFHPRRAFLWSYLGALLSLVILAIASPLPWETQSPPTQDPQSPQFTQLPARRKWISLPRNFRHRHRSCGKNVESFEKEPRATELVEPDGKPVESAGKTASEVIETRRSRNRRSEKPVPSLALSEMGPKAKLTGEIEVPQQPVKAEPAAPVQQAESPPAAKTVDGDGDGREDSQDDVAA